MTVDAALGEVARIRAELHAAIETTSDAGFAADLLIELRQALWDYEDIAGEPHEVEDELLGFEQAVFPPSSTGASNW